uniref:Nonribosomal peptide synthetase/polyketide synthase hybrid n=1 Tax=Karenia brevis TaxID=156230 RepID=D2CZD4_KARBR|nr:nonribosomal peptide synthetase/polyketide synthase hybrid [Karenia brevis]
MRAQSKQGSGPNHTAESPAPRALQSPPRSEASSGEGSCLPLSFAQQRLWFLDQLVPGNPFYNINSAVPIQGAISLTGFKWSLEQMVRRHESLRTCFREVDGQPRQIVLPALEIELPVTDLQDLEPAEQASQTEVLANAEGRTPFDLKSTPLFRASFIKQGPQDHLFLLTMHHIICDGWSTEVFWREINEYYTSYLSGREPQLPDLPLQYGDFAVWQREWLSGAVLDDQLAYWRQQLSGLAQLELPTDFPRPPEMSFRGANVKLHFSRRLTSAIKVLSRREGCTLFMTQLALFKVLLSQFSGQNDLAIGCPVACRTRTELESLIGFFVNTLVLRSQLTGEMSFRDFLQVVRETAVGAFNHQDLPFEMLVEHLQPDRDLSRNPIFQVMFQLFNPTQGDSEKQHPEKPAQSPPQLGRGTAIFDLALHLSEGPDGLWGMFEYSTDLFEEQTIQRMADGLEQITERVIRDPGITLNDLRVIEEAEVQRLVAQGQAYANDGDRPKSILEHLKARQLDRGEALAIIDHDVRWTYQQLLHRSSLLARRLNDLTHTPEARVAVALSRSWRIPLTFLACIQADVVYVPLDVSYPPDRLQRIIEDAQPEVILTERQFDSVFPAETPRMFIEDHEEVFAPNGQPEEQSVDPIEPRLLDPERLLYLIYTSGSTGVPKGIAMPHQAMNNLVQWQRERDYFDPHAVVLQFPSVGFDVSIQEFLTTLCLGGTLVITQEAERSDPFTLWSLIQEHSVQRMFLAPAALHQLAEAVDTVKGGEWQLRELIVAGDRCKSHPPSRGCWIDCLVGPSTTNTVLRKPTSLARSPYITNRQRFRPIRRSGSPSQTAKSTSSTNHSRPCPTALLASFISGATVWHGDTGTKIRKRRTGSSCPSPAFSKANVSIVRAISQFRRRDGSLEFRGRRDKQIKLRGYRIELSEIEATLTDHPRIRHCAVRATGPTDYERSLIAYVVLTDEAHEPQTDWSEAFRQHVRARLPGFMVPATFMVLDELPLTRNGKIDDQRLPSAASSPGESGKAKTKPRNELEAFLAETWADVLNHSDVGIHEHFFSDLAGHSLLATQVITRIRSALRVDLPLSQLFRSPTVATLAAHLESQLKQQLTPS